MKKYFILFALSFFWIQAKSQLIQTLNLHSSINFSKIEGEFTKKHDISNGIDHECYEFNSITIALSYYPIQNGINCGYFVLNDNKFEPNSTLNKLACDLDYGSFEVFKLEYQNCTFILLNAIGNVGGSATRRVFNNLFRVSDKKIQYFPLVSIYGSEKNFGDFNNDGQFDYLETNYDNFDPNYKVIFTTLKKDQFIKDQTKFIRFTKLIHRDLFKVKVIERKWW